MKLGVIDVGGGLRDIYGSGIFDFCIDAGIRFDLCIGVSAGGANVCSFLAGQRNRNYPFYTVYPLRKEYMGFGHFLKTGSFLNLDYIYSDLSNSDGENPLDYQSLCRNPSEMIIVATDASTAKPVYFTKDDFQQDSYQPLKSSSAIPFISRPYETRGIPCFDGALSDPVPVKKALEEGCDKVVVILTKPKDNPRVPGKDPKLAAMIRRKYPECAKALRDRYLLYNAQVEEAKRLEVEGRACILSPDTIGDLGTLTKDIPALKALYEKGYSSAQQRLPAFLSFQSVS